MTVQRGRVHVFVGTRPELIKLAPIVQALRAVAGAPWRISMVFTGQHEELVTQAAEVFGFAADHRLHVMRRNDNLAALTARLLIAINELLEKEEPDLVVIQGDTTTVLCTALAAFYRHIAVAHVEAGLRTHDLAQPFPEEANRSLVARLANLNFAPTELARDALLAEGIDARRILVTGNTVIDAVLAVAGRVQPEPVFARHGVPATGGPLILTTMHRRESWDTGIGEVCRALRLLTARRPDLRIVLPVHPGPIVNTRIHAELANQTGIFLLPPLDYASFLAFAGKAYLFLTDSGGLQEEGAALHKPVLVLRDKTERMEAVTAGIARLVGTDTDNIVHQVSRLLDEPEEYRRMSSAPNPFGDGNAAVRIARHISHWFDTHRPATEGGYSACGQTIAGGSQ